jgi:hypothetical protein
MTKKFKGCRLTLQTGIDSAPIPSCNGERNADQVLADVLSCDNASQGLPRHLLAPAPSSAPIPVVRIA